MEKNELFTRTVNAVDKLNKAISMGFPGYYVDKLDAELDALWRELEKLGLVDEFADFALC